MENMPLENFKNSVSREPVESDGEYFRTVSPTIMYALLKENNLLD